MSAWTADELRTLDRVGEIRVAGRRDDGTPRPLVVIWHVVVEAKLYVRSVRGVAGGWYKGVIRHHEGVIAWDGQTRDVTYVPDDSADGAVDAAYFAKYGHGAPSRAITSAEARVTTLRVEPR